MLRHAFRHLAWANGELIARCRALSDEQMDATTPGTYGGIRATMQHILEAEGRYLRHITGEAPPWLEGAGGREAPLEELAGWAEDLSARWASLLERETDPDRLVSVRGEFDERVGVLLAQALHHGSEHRAQIFTTMTVLGIEPPDLDAWSYGETLR